MVRPSDKARVFQLLLRSDQFRRLLLAPACSMESQLHKISSLAQKDKVRLLTVQGSPSPRPLTHCVRSPVTRRQLACNLSARQYNQTHLHWRQTWRCTSTTFSRPTFHRS